MAKTIKEKTKAVKKENLTINELYKNYRFAKTVNDKKKYYDLISKKINNVN